MRLNLIVAAENYRRRPERREPLVNDDATSPVRNQLDLVTETRRQRVFAENVLNVLVNIVVLNLFVEISAAVVIDSFWISLLTALLLTAMIGLLSKVEARVHHFFFETHSWRVAGVISIWLILFGGKFVMLEIVNIVFGDRVELGHLLEVILIVVAMMVAFQLMKWVYDRLGVGDDSTESTSG